MDIYFKRNDDWLASLIKNGFEIGEITKEKIKLITDMDLFEMIMKYSEFDEPIFDNLKDCVIFEGLITEEELDTIRYLEEKKSILASGKKHVYLLDQEGFYGDPETMDYSLADDYYHVSFHLNNEMSNHFLKKEILFYLKDIRVKETTKYKP